MRDLLQALEAELDFLRDGGYERHEAWRPLLLFEDSPICVKRHRRASPAGCQSGPLLQFVPERHRSDDSPCRHVRLTPAGETADSLYRWGTPEELSRAAESWLSETIAALEAQSPSPPDVSCCPQSAA